jgi:outer membrane protein assembly factor BamB
MLAAAAAGCWGQPGFNARHQGSNPLESPLTPDTVAALAPAWTARVDAGPVRAEPVLTGGLDAVLVSDDGAAYALDPGTGARRWRTAVVPAGGPAGLVAGPVTVDGEQALVPWGGGAADSGAVVRLAVGDGHVVGQAPTVGPLEVTARSPWRATSASGVVETTLPFGSVTIEWPVPWFLVTDFGSFSAGPPPTAATLTADRLFVGLGAGFYGTNVLDAWDLDRGCPVTGPDPQPAICQPDLRTQLDGRPTTPVVDDAEATVYVATAAGTVYAVDAATGAVRWNAPAGAAVHQRPALGTGGLFVATDDGRLLTFDPAGCGAAACTATRTVALAGPPDTPPAVAGGVVYVAAGGGTLAAWPAAGPAPAAPRWSAALGSPITGGPTVAVGTLYAGTADGRVVAYRAGPGA